MTSTQAAAAFAAHAVTFPATHVNIIAPLPAGVAIVAGTFSELGIVALIPTAASAAASAAVGAPGVAVSVNSVSTRPDRGNYRTLVSMSSCRAKWASKTIAHEFMSKLETALRQSPILPTHWIYLIPMMIPEE